MSISTLLNSARTPCVVNGMLNSRSGGALAATLAYDPGMQLHLQQRGFAVLSELAWLAYQRYRFSQQGPQQPLPLKVPRLDKQHFQGVVEPAAAQHKLLLQTMISAVHANGPLTPSRHKAFWRQAVASCTSPSILNALRELLNAPLAAAELAADAPEGITRIIMYTAAVLAAEPGERGSELFLQGLAAQLQLPLPLTDALHSVTGPSQSAA